MKSSPARFWASLKWWMLGPKDFLRLKRRGVGLPVRVKKFQMGWAANKASDPGASSSAAGLKPFRVSRW